MLIMTMVAYKLFRTKKNDTNLYPLYVFANEPTPVGVWIKAKKGEKTLRGKVKSRLGELAFRPGWHSGEYPIALHIGEKANPHDSHPSYRPDNQVWCEVLVNDNQDWQLIADKMGKYDRDKCLKEIPVNGFYRYKTNPNMFGKWIISGEIKITRILSDEEVKKINAKIGVDDLPRRQ